MSYPPEHERLVQLLADDEDRYPGTVRRRIQRRRQRASTTDVAKALREGSIDLTAVEATVRALGVEHDRLLVEQERAELAGRIDYGLIDRRMKILFEIFDTVLAARRHQARKGIVDMESRAMIVAVDSIIDAIRTAMEISVVDPDMVEQVMTYLIDGLPAWRRRMQRELDEGAAA